ncbi:hypothetical protein MMC09_004047 [Bachmanniomyces sp. S44760]|nr:hypothetical protein [Bachmanniomyces sp. S44760]
MRSCLSAGIDTAKGLAVAWQIPLVAVNHMQAHALTPRLVSALSRSTDQPAKTEPTFPFLSLLVSGGHTLLIYSKGLTDHSVLATTTDIAIGDAIDKIAKHVLPSDLIIHSQDTMYGRMLEEFAFPRGFMDHKYNPPVTRASELARKISPWGWDLVPPLAETRSGSKNRSMEFSFSGLETACRRIMERRCAEGENPREREDCMGHEERQFLAREAMRTAFEHLAGRVVLALQAMDLETKTTSKHSRQSNSDSPDPKAISTLVVSGGVAANAYLKTILRSFLDKRGYGHIGLVFPPAELCTDNAAMIAWTGMEMFAQGWQSDLAVRALRKWSLDSDGESEGEEGASGVLGVGGWILREGFNEKEGERENPLIS